MTRKVLLGCGIVAAVLYIVMDVLGALRFPGYSYTPQAISELSAIGAPSRPLMLSLGWIYDVLLVAFAVGVWRTTTQMHRLRSTAAALLGIAFVGFIWMFFPMHLRGAAPTLTDTMHVVIAGIQTVLIFVAIGASASAPAVSETPLTKATDDTSRI